MRRAHEEQVKAITLTRANKRVWQRLNEGIEKHMADKAVC